MANTSSRKPINLQTWNRKEHFEFFRAFDEPFFGVTVAIDCTKTYHNCKSNGDSFFIKYLHNTLVAVNATPSFKLRIHDGLPYEYDQINVSPTIARKNGTFGFSYMDYTEDFEVFKEHAQAVIAQVEVSTGLDPTVSGQDVIHFSSLPWLNFTAVSHARNFKFEDSCPKISFGKMTELNGKKSMPMSIHVHHSLVDGKDVAEFAARVETLM